VIKRVELPLVGGTGGYFGQQFDPERTVNLFVAYAPGTNYKALITIPGAETIYTNTQGENTRALFENTDNLFAIFGNELVSFDNALNPLSVGTINTSIGTVRIADNNSQQIMFVDNVDGWVYDFSTVTPTFTQITDTGFTSYNAPRDVDFLDGHMIVGFNSSNRWSISALNDATSWPALNTAFLTSAGNERIEGIRVINRRIFIFGRTVTERWYNSGAASSFPFVRDDNLILQYGCVATGSIAKGSLTNGESVLAWLAQNETGSPSIRITEGGASQPISTPNIDYKLQFLTNLENAFGYMFRIDGHSFYLINFIDDKLTLVYDFDSKVWHEQEMMNEDPYFSCCHAYFQNKHILGHHDAPKLSELNSDFVTNPDENIKCIRETSIFSLPSNERVLLDRVQVEMRQGIGAKTTRNRGNNTYDGFELAPKMFLAYSDNGGYTYGDQYTMPVGKVGEAFWITAWDLNALSDRHSFRFYCTYGAKTILLNMAAQISDRGY